jgi:hypothetical protein
MLPTSNNETGLFYVSMILKYVIQRYLPAVTLPHIDRLHLFSLLANNVVCYLPATVSETGKSRNIANLKLPALYHSYFQISIENTVCRRLQITTIYNLEIMIYAIHLSIKLKPAYLFHPLTLINFRGFMDEKSPIFRISCQLLPLFIF